MAKKKRYNGMKPGQNAFLAKLQAQAAAREAPRSEAHVQIDTMAMLFAVNDELQVGPGRSPGVVNSFLNWKLDIADAIVKELDEDQSKKKEFIVVKRNLTKKLKGILGAEGWAQYKTLFPILEEFWED